MRKPWWRSQTQTWYCTINGKQKALGKDEHGAGKKHPPKAIADVWHRLNRTAEGKDMPLSEVVDLYVQSLKHPKTQAETSRQLKAFLAFTGTISVSKLRLHHVSSYLATKPTWNSTSQATAVERITSALNWAVAQGYIEAHSVKYPRGQKPRKRRRVVVLCDEHVLRIEEAAFGPVQAVLKAMRLSGARPNEICSATIDNYDEDKGILLVWNKTRETTGVEWRPLYCSEAMREHIRMSIAGRQSGPIFPNSKGEAYPPPQIAHQVRKIRLKLNLPKECVPYALRHSFASRAINEANINPALVAKMLGHAGMEMIRVYFHEDHEAMRRAVEQVQSPSQ